MRYTPRNIIKQFRLLATAADIGGNNYELVGVFETTTLEYSSRRADGPYSAE